MTDDPRIDPADLRNVRFPGSSRRYDARSVDQFLETVAARIAATNVLVDELRAQLADAQAHPVPAAPPAPTDLSLLDEDQIVRLVGEETATVLSTARRAAEEIRSKAEESAARVIREATAEADRLAEEARSGAAELTTEAEEAHARATEAAEAAAAQIRTEADAEVARILEQAREEGRGMVAEAREVRARVLDDLQRRRDAARQQIDRLEDGRERLLAAYDRVRENLDEITGELADALPEPPGPELPDGFVGIVGGTPADAPAAAQEPDDTVAPPSADAGAEPADVDDVVVPDEDGREAPVGPEDLLGPVPEDALLGSEPGAGTADPDAPAPHPTAAEDGSATTPDDAVDPEPADEPAAEDSLAPVPEAAAGDEPSEREAAVDEDADHVDRAVAGDDPPDASADPIAAEVPVVEEATAAADPDEPVESATDEPVAGDVDALFARLRAEREQSVARAQEVLGDADADAVADVASDGAAAIDPADEAPSLEADEPSSDAEPSATPAGDVDHVAPELLADDDDLERRTEALRPLEQKLNRALKRRLADEQNELLDLVRRSSSIETATLLPDLEGQVTGYAGVAASHLAGAAAAGGGADAEVADLAEALARSIVEPFHRRVERAAADVDDADELDERLRALYREWKAQHVGPAAADALLSAYAAGTLAGASGAPVRWRIDPGQGPCPDAQDNALAGAVVAGEAFPTGDACPQAHPGCRCLLVAGGA